MRALLSLCLGLLLALPGALQADSFAFAFNPRTGDAVFDAHLGDINILASRNLPGFVDDIAVSFALPRVEVHALVVEQRFAPADVYMIAHTARLSGLSFQVVADRYKNENGQGWGVIAKNLGIKPGSAEFHALKSGAEKSKGKGWAKQGANPATGQPANTKGVDQGKGKSQGQSQGKAKGKKK